jgi:hypothetical protein
MPGRKVRQMTDATIAERPKQRNATVQRARALSDVEPEYLRRRDAVLYARQKWGLGSQHTFCHAEGPKFTLVRKRLALYRREDIDAWARDRIEAASNPSK